MLNERQCRRLAEYLDDLRTREQEARHIAGVACQPGLETDLLAYADVLRSIVDELQQILTAPETPVRPPHLFREAETAA